MKHYSNGLGGAYNRDLSGIVSEGFGKEPKSIRRRKDSCVGEKMNPWCCRGSVALGVCMQKRSTRGSGRLGIQIGRSLAVAWEGEKEGGLNAENAILVKGGRGGVSEGRGSLAGGLHRESGAWGGGVGGKKTYAIRNGLPF